MKYMCSFYFLLMGPQSDVYFRQLAARKQTNVLVLATMSVHFLCVFYFSLSGCTTRVSLGYSCFISRIPTSPLPPPLCVDDNLRELCSSSESVSRAYVRRLEALSQYIFLVIHFLLFFLWSKLYRTAHTVRYCTSFVLPLVDKYPRPSCRNCISPTHALFTISHIP